MKQRVASVIFFIIFAAIALGFYTANLVKAGVLSFALDRIAIVQLMVIRKQSIAISPNIILLLLVMVTIGLTVLAELEMRKKEQSSATLVLHLILVSVALIGTQIILNAIASVILKQRIALDNIGILALPIAVTGIYGPLRIWFWQKPEPNQDSLHRGIKVIFDATRSARVLGRKARKMGATGIAIHDSLTLSTEQETKHTLLIAAPGGGKTQVIYPLIKKIRKRGDGILLYDFKGDYTAAFGEDPGVVILSPFDARGLGWDIAADVTTDIKAMEFAACLLPDGESKEPFFKKAAQDLLTGVITKLIIERPREWGIGNLVDLLANKAEVVAACERYRPAALSALGPVGEKQASGVFGELRTGSIQLEYLARAWPVSHRKISLTQWVRNSEFRKQYPVLMLRGHQQYRRLDGFLTALVCSIVIKEALALPDSYERRIWAILDEFGNLPRIDGIDTLLTGVRSKGVRIVAAIQDIAQIEETYSRAFAQTFFNCFGTILAGLCSGATARYLSDAFGKNKIDRLQRSKSRNKGTGGKANSTAITESHQSMIENALIDTDFSNLETPSLRTPASFWLRISGWPIGRLAYPVRPLPMKYPSHVEPSWLNETPSSLCNDPSDSTKAVAFNKSLIPLVREYKPFSMGPQVSSNKRRNDGVTDAND